MNWVKIVTELLDSGMSQTELAIQIGLKPPSIADIVLKRQKSVRWEVGNKLLHLHRTKFPAGYMV